MAEMRLEGMRVAILVTDDFEQVEMTEPRKALEEAGATAHIVSPHGGRIQGMNHDVHADTFDVDQTLDKASPDLYDAVMIPGGALNADALRVVKKAQDFVRRMQEQDKPLAVICHGPWLLVSAGLVKGRTLTSYHTIQDDVRNAGGHWVDQEVAKDGNWVSSRNPKDIPAFNKAMVDLFTQSGRKTAETMGEEKTVEEATERTSAWMRQEG